MSGAIAVLLFCGTLLPQGGVEEDRVRAVVQQYFDAQAQKDVDKVLSLWSTAAAAPPTRAALGTVFNTGDDEYTVAIRSVNIEGTVARVRLTGERVRTVRRGDSAAVFRSAMLSGLTLAREADGWKITSEQSAADEVAGELIAASAAERVRLFDDPVNTSIPVRQALASRGSRFAMAQQYPSSQAVFEVALETARAAHDRRHEGEMLQNLANALYFQREFVKAAERYQERLALGREMQDDDAIAASTLGIATVAYARGEYTPALASYREALAIYERAGTDPSIGTTLISIGNVQFLQAEYDSAAASYRRALALLQATPDFGGVAMARSGLGRVFAARGDVASALEMHTRVLEEARARTPASGPAPGVDVAATLETIGELHYRIGNSDQARAAFDEARRMSDSRNDFSTAGRLFADLGLTELMAGKYDAALAAYMESRARFEQLRRADGVARAWIGIGFSQSAREKYSDAIAAYRTAITSLEGQQLEEEAGRAWLGLSLAQSSSGDSAAALESARRVRSIADNVGSGELKWRAAVREGDALRKLSRVDEAQRAFQDAIESIQQLAGNAAISAEARADLEGSGSAWAGLAFALAQRGDAIGALVAEEQRRAHVRRLFLAPFERDIVRGAAAADQEQEQQIFRDLISARAQLRAERSLRSPDAARLQRLKQQVATLSTARADQQAQLYSRVPDLRRWRGLGPSAAATDLNAMLSLSRALAIEYVLSDDELLILTAEYGESGLNAGAAIVPLSKRDLADRISRATESNALRDAEEWRKRSALVSEILMAPIAERFSGRERCIVLPDGVLWKVPFEALAVSTRGVLASRMGVTYATSMMTLAAQRAAQAPVRDDGPALSLSKGPGFAAVAGPDVAAPLRAQLAVTSPGWTPPDPAAAIDSTRRISAPYGEAATIVSGKDATETAARALGASADILHVAAPLQISTTSPLLSAVLLASTGESRDADGRWELRDWFAASGRARVLVIPDGASFGAPGAAGAMDALAWASAAAGFSTLALGRSPRDAYSQDAVLVAWNQRLAQSALTPADALRAAIAAVREKDGGAPAAWAGIRVLGGHNR